MLLLDRGADVDKEDLVMYFTVGIDSLVTCLHIPKCIIIIWLHVNNSVMHDL